jgi:subtilisin family serine protease
MTLTPGDDLTETLRQRTRDQYTLLKAAHGDDIITDTDDAADFNFICSSKHLLVSAARIDRLEQYFNDRLGDDGDDVFDGEGRRADNQPREDLFFRYEPPRRRLSRPGDKSILVTLDELDRDAQDDPELEDIATPDHVIHICGTGRGSICPANEPTETGRQAEPWPPNQNPNAGAGVNVVVIDTGWYHPDTDPQDPEEPAPIQPWWWLEGVRGESEPNGVFDDNHNIRPYAGHGTFVAGVIRSMAPKCDVRVLRMSVDPTVPHGGVLESDMVTRLDDAVRAQPEPHLINLSAGCPTRNDRPSRALEDWWHDAKVQHPNVLLVAAAGNNSTMDSFWPASFGWAVGVGSLDRDGHVSDFSNWGDSADLFALGRNLINAFPDGTYICFECPDRLDERIFDHGLARWSGTSFSAPLVTGLIAAAMSRPGGTMEARAAYDEVRAAAGLVRVVRPVHMPAVLEDLVEPPDEPQP